MAHDSRPVYSSELGRLCPACGKPPVSCICAEAQNPPAGDGIVRIRQESKGRGGKTVTVVSGIPLAEAALKTLAGELKRRCATGGTVKGAIVEIQGDHLETLLSDLQKRGFKVKKSGG